MTNETFKLIVITPEKDIAGEAKLINALFDAGLQFLHIRKPDNTGKEMQNLITSISQDFYSKIVLHSHYELLHDYNLKGLHLPEKTRKEGTISGIKNIVSTSFHTLEDIATEKTSFEYAFFSPVFQSISKEGYKPTIETTTLKGFFHSDKSTPRFPIIALGGITDENILQARGIGFQGAACIGYIWEQPDPVAQFKKLQKILQANY